MEISPQNIKISEYDYPLPDERIAKHPLAQRDSCKLLTFTPGAEIETHVFSELPDLLPDDAMLVYNDTRVINARLRFHKSSGALIEIFCLEPVLPADYAENFACTGRCRWLCFVGNSKRWKDGALTMEINIGGEPLEIHAERIEKRGNASVVEFSWDRPSCTFASVIEACGEIPIPPYLNRSTEESDSKDYQTVYSHVDGSVAAPTAGLHFTEPVLQAISRRGIPRRELTLHVGAGTFQPVKDDNVGEHQMHSEFISVSRELIAELSDTPRRVFAVGTTSVRTLESLYHIGCLLSEGKFTGEVPQWYPYSPEHPELSVKDAMQHIINHLDSTGADRLVASTRIIIAPGYTYKIVRGIITNFHQPKSTLLLLVSAFIGDTWRDIYSYALDNGYRFLSYGDACLFSLPSHKA